MAVVLVVGGERDQSAATESKGENHLVDDGDPDVEVENARPIAFAVYPQVPLEPFRGA